MHPPFAHSFASYHLLSCRLIPAMGFPVPYLELPKLLLQLLFLLAHLRWLLNSAFRAVGLVESEPQQWHQEETRSLIQESSPAIQFERLLLAAGQHHHVPESCAVCLSEFEPADEVRRMSGCCHVFHRRCVDRWLEHGKRTCALCRAPLVVAAAAAVADEDC